jgi:hypothetical protein
MRIEVSEVRADVPAMAPGAWDGLAGDPPGYAECVRTTLLAYADVLSNELRLLAAWDGDALRGLAIAVLGDLSRRRTLMLALPGNARSGLEPGGLWHADGPDAEAVIEARLGALRPLARELGAEWVGIGGCPADGPSRVRAVAARLGFRAVPGVAFHVLPVPEGTTLEGYVEALPREWRRNFRYNLRWPEKAGATIEHRTAVPEAWHERMWDLQHATFTSKEAFFRFDRERNLFDALARRGGGRPIKMTTCMRGDELLCYFLVDEAGDTAYVGLVGHHVTPGFNAYGATLAHAVAHQIERGVREIVLSTTSDEAKRRMGSVARPVAALLVRA